MLLGNCAKDGCVVYKGGVGVLLYKTKSVRTYLARCYFSFSIPLVNNIYYTVPLPSI